MTTLAESEFDQVFVALSDPMRRRVLEALGGQRARSATALAADLPVTWRAFPKHLAVLENSRLVTSHKLGREVLYTVQPDRLVATASWMTTLASTWADRLQMLKRIAESEDTS
jgi:DNA-binding transcriptional ArsR family regulator